MSTADWNSLDVHTLPLPTIVSSSDLFDGEFFDDELIDIYINTVEQVEIEHHDIPLLPHPASIEFKKEDDHTEDILAAMDEGFSGLPHSSSYNDLDNLLTESATEASVPVAPSTAPTTTVTVTVPTSPVPVQTVAGEPTNPTTPASKKRSADSNVISPGPKKKPVSPKRASVTKKSPQPPKAAAASPAKPSNSSTAANGTPNPITNQSADKSAPKIPKVVISKTGGVTHNVKVTEVAAAPAVNTFKATISPSTSEASFKSLAQAAVSELITSSGLDDTNSECTFNFKVDTSTAHIKALTGNNWVAACNGTSAGVASSVASDNDDSKSNCNRNKRVTLTADERARQNRDRNREHARNTRLRKKAYVEELKHTLTELVSQRDASDLEKKQSAQRELEQREVRFRVIEEFLKLRGRDETNFARWAAILEDDFTFTVPSADMKSLRVGGFPVEVALRGVSTVMADSANFSAFLQTFRLNESQLFFHHQCDRKDFFMDGCTAVLEWNGSTTDSEGKVEKSGLTLKGTVRAKFSPASNKLLSATMSFDTCPIFVQVQKLNASNLHSPLFDKSFDLIDAQAAAGRADAILDSLEMPSCVTVGTVDDTSTSSPV